MLSHGLKFDRMRTYFKTLESNLSLFEVCYGLYVFLCALYVPYRALVRDRLIPLSLLLVFVPFTVGVWLYSYLHDPQYADDHGIAVAGLFLTVPGFSFLAQLLIYKIGKQLWQR